MPPRAKKSVKTSDGGKRHPLNVRTTFETRQRLEKAASESGRSLTQEAELKIEQSFRAQDFAMSALEMTYGAEIAGLALAMADILNHAAVSARALSGEVLDGSGWLDDPIAFSNAAKGVQVFLDGLRPPGHPTPEPVNFVGSREGFDALPVHLKKLIEGLCNGELGAKAGKRKLAVLAGKESVTFSREDIQKRLLAPTMQRISKRPREE